MNWAALSLWTGAGAPPPANSFHLKVRGVDASAGLSDRSANTVAGEYRHTVDALKSWTTTEPLEFYSILALLGFIAWQHRLKARDSERNRLEFEAKAGSLILPRKGWVERLRSTGHKRPSRDATPLQPPAQPPAIPPPPTAPEKTP